MGVVAPAKTRKDVIARLNGEIVRGARSPELVDKFNAVGIVAAANRPEEFEQFIKAETERWGEVIRRSGAKIE